MTPTWDYHLLLLIGHERVQQTLRAFRGNRSNAEGGDTWWIILLGAILAGTVFIALLWERWQRRTKAMSPETLFVDLCQAHQLNWAERRLLRRLARSQKLTDPGRVFLTPECFDIGRLTVEMRPHVKELYRLRDRLFAEPKQETPTEPEVEPAVSVPAKTANASLPLPTAPPTLVLPTWTTSPGSETTTC